MPANMVLLEKITVGAAGASNVTFSGIPQTGYTDLVVKLSVRSDRTSLASPMRLYPNGITTGITLRFLQGDGTSRGSGTQTTFSAYSGETSGASSTASTFGSHEIYIPNYTSSNYKSFSIDSVSEDNAASAYAQLFGNLWSNSAPITSLQILDGLGNFVQHSTFYLYGIAKKDTTPVIAPFATGGDTIMTDGTYWYHAFKASGTFTPAKALSVDYLVVAGGGGGFSYGGGGGAGGFRTSTGFSCSSGTGLTVTVGAGGSGSTGAKGSNSVFSTITSSGGGHGQGAGTNSGGSGGGADSSNVFFSGGTGNFGGYSPVEGYAGGNNNSGGSNPSGGGGGAGAVGGTPVNSTTVAAGGTGTNSDYSGSTVTYAGGGGGFIRGGGAGGAGGSGGGGGGGTTSVSGTAGTANLGGGGGAGSPNGGNGGSGIVLVRYSV